MNDIEFEMKRKNVPLIELVNCFKIGPNAVRYAILGNKRTAAANRLRKQIMEYIENKPEPRIPFYSDEIRPAKRIALPIPSLQKWILSLKEQK